MLFVTTFTVVGKYPFPLDMLRYDACYPDGSDDAAKIGYTLDPQELHHAKDAFRITVVHHHNHRAWKPTAARWSSFMWSVDSESIKTRTSWATPMWSSIMGMDTLSP